MSESENETPAQVRESWIRARRSLGRGAPSILFGTSTGALDRAARRLEAAEREAREHKREDEALRRALLDPP